MQKKILIIEDDVVLIEVLATKVKSLNYIVVQAKNGEEGIAKLAQEKPDLILLDVILPLKSGFEVLEEIKGKQKSTVPVIILSNLDSPQEIEKGMKLGAVDYMIKSNFSLHEIMSKIAKYLPTPLVV